MKFEKQSFHHNEADNHLWNPVKNALDGLDGNQRNSVKIASSDRQNGASRTVIIYTDDAAPEGTQSELSTTWDYKRFEQMSKDADDAYNDCVSFLNGSTLTDLQKYYALLSMCDTGDNQFYVFLWFRKVGG
ncbi:MAG TPA: hypothetical protein DCE42_26265 [Myxococcales bacterium]|nr:hypothetical protein [Myxococcales bacterium]